MNQNKNGTYFCCLYNPLKALTKQLCSLAGCIEYHIDNKHHIIILDNFSYKDKLVPISNIIDIEHLSSYLYHKKQTIEIIDKNIINFKILSITYGNMLTFNLTPFFHLKNNVLDIYPGLLEKVIVKMKYKEIGEKIMNIKYSLKDGRAIDENFVIKNDHKLDDKDRIIIDYSILNDSFKPSPIRTLNHDLKNMNNVIMNSSLFIDIFKNIRFHTKFYHLINKILPKGDINIIHLKLDPYDIKKYSGIFNMDETEFLSKVEDKYIYLIDKHLKKETNTIVLTNSSIKNRVISYLSENSYTHSLSYDLYSEHKDEEFPDFIEYSDILNLCLAIKCNSVFIGCEISSYSKYIVENLKIRDKYLLHYNTESELKEDKTYCFCF